MTEWTGGSQELTGATQEGELGHVRRGMGGGGGRSQVGEAGQRPEG